MAVAKFDWLRRKTADHAILSRAFGRDASATPCNSYMSQQRPLQRDRQKMMIVTATERDNMTTLPER